jgi:arabinofuranosyltransferase
MTSSISTRDRVILGAAIASLLLLAWALRWTQDDAYITFVYARHLLRGDGVVWNPGYAVEGYTNFLWMLGISAGLWLGLSAELASYVLGLASFAASLLLVFQLARKVIGDTRWALVGTLLVGCNYSFLMYATGGLETQLDVALTLALFYIALSVRETGKPSRLQLGSFSVLAALSVMTRPDSVLACTVAAALIVISYAGSVSTEASRAWRGQAFGHAALLITPALAILGTWLSWKYRVYGDLLPNTFRVKVGHHGVAMVLRGIAYVGWLFVSYWWLPLFVAIVIFARARLRGMLPKVLPLLVFSALWAAYVAWVGGDIMEFRLLIPIIPMLIIVLVAALARLEPRFAVIGVGVMLLGSLSHAVAFPLYVRPEGICTVPWLQRSARLFRAIGVNIGQALKQNPDVTIAVMPAGFIPYFSNARSIDMLGLNDRWVAQNGYTRGCRVCLGHARLATFAYLNHAKVDLIVAGPQYYNTAKCLRKQEVAKQMMFGEPIDYENIPSGARVISIPIHDPEFAYIAALYVRPNAAIDDALAKGLWREIPEC